jgi:arginine-tRNA-protein transferase
LETLAEFYSPAKPCSYLPDQFARMHYELVTDLDIEEYQQRLVSGWRRFGRSLFEPACPRCQRCQSLRVPVSQFRPDRSQRRAWAANHGEVKLVIDEPSVTREKLRLSDRFHAFQSDHVGWHRTEAKDPDDYFEAFVDNPIPTEEWRYYLGERLIGVGYVDRLPVGLSAIYFFHDPDERKRSLGTYNVLCAIEAARAAGLPHLYLGYFVAGCRSLEYKARFQPNEVLTPDGTWQPFLSR